MKRIFACLLALLVCVIPAQAVGGVWESLDIDGAWTENAEINGDASAVYYRIDVPEQGLLTVTLQSWINAIDYKLWDENLTRCMEETTVWYGKVNEPVSKNVTELYLPAGTYYAEVSQSGDNSGEYRLRSTFTSGQCNESEPNDPASFATPVQARRVYRSMVWMDDGYDYYSFDIAETQKVEIVVKSYTNTLTVGMRDGFEMDAIDADGKKVDDYTIYYGKPSEAVSHVIDRKLKAGTYLVMIKRSGGETGIYELMVNGDLVNDAPAPQAPAVDVAPAAPAAAQSDAAQSWYCPNCGTPNEGNFCYNCGTPNPRK